MRKKVSKKDISLPNRKEREEIDQLKDKISKSAEEYNSKEKKLKFTIERQKKQIEELLKRNKELEDQVQLFEQLRLKGGEEKIGSSLTRGMSGNAADKSASKIVASLVQRKNGEDTMAGLKSSAFAESAKNSKSPTPQGGVAPRKLGSLNNVARKSITRWKMKCTKKISSRITMRRRMI